MQTDLLISVAKTEAPTSINAVQLHLELTGVISGHVNAENPWTFYEQIDQLLGPWGHAGYPLAYGKYYCRLFYQDAALQRNAETRLWVQKTIIRLQELLRDAIVDCFQRGKLFAITEPELRALAVSTHATAYDESGLSLMASAAPHLLPAIAFIPAVKWQATATAPWPQVLETLRAIASVSPANALSDAAAAPARHGIIQRSAATSDMNALLAEQRRHARYRNQFSKIRDAIRSKRLNRLLWLNELTERLAALPLPDAHWRTVAQELIDQAGAQKAEVSETYLAMLNDHPEIRAKIDEIDPAWNQPSMRADVCA